MPRYTVSTQRPASFRGGLGWMFCRGCGVRLGRAMPAVLSCEMVGPMERERETQLREERGPDWGLQGPDWGPPLAIVTAEPAARVMPWSDTQRPTLRRALDLI